MTWENSGVCRGNLLTQKEYDKLSDGDKKKVYTWTTDAGETFYCLPKDTARYIVVKHLNEQVPFTEFWSDKVFTPEYLDYINENVIHPMFQLPDQSAFDDVKDLEETMGISDESKEDDPIAEANID